MKYVYFDAFAGASGDMILGALLDLEFPPAAFLQKMADLNLPVKADIQEVHRAGLRGLRVEVRAKKGRESGPRRFVDIEQVIHNSRFSRRVKDQSLAVFRTLFEAEARVHGEPLGEVHLHEAGADDAIFDIVGSAFLAESLKIGKVFCSPLNVGSGTIRTAHGRLPVPAPAVAEILRGAPVYSAWVKEELVTPTGAAILATWATKFIPFPEMNYEKVGCGAGSRDPQGFPNILRAFFGDEKDFRAEKAVFQVETNIDDSSPQLLAAFAEQALRLGALDVFQTPIVMKKGRLATKLTLLVEADKMERLVALIFRETPTIGLRYFPVSRRILQRDVESINVLGREVRVKIATEQGMEVNVQPEFADCLRAAREKNVPLKEVQRMAIEEYYKKKHERTMRA